MSKIKNSTIFAWIFAGMLLSCTVILFLWVKIAGVYAVATIVEGVPTSEGVDYSFTFMYNGLEYRGNFTGMKEKLGAKYFVQFLPSDPDKNFLNFYEPVPACFQDSLHLVWESIPKCK